MDLATISRFPILRGFDLRGSANRFSQSRGHFSAWPPNSSMSFRESPPDVHAISSCSRLRPGLEMMTSLPGERVCKMFSCVLSQPRSASLRHRCIVSNRPRVLSGFAQGYGERSSLRFALRSRQMLERVTRLELATSSLARRCSTTELHPRFEREEIMSSGRRDATFLIAPQSGIFE